MTRKLALEALIGLALFVFGGSIGWFTTRHFTGQPLFYQGEFGPAVMIAAGRGFVNPVLTPGSPAADFLSLRRSSLDAGAVREVATQPVDALQQQMRYLMWAVGYEWKLTGISWRNVAGVSALLFGLSIAACYLTARVLLPRTFALAGALFMSISPLHLAQVPHLRDYSKAPFILAALGLTLASILLPLSRRARIAAAAACGVVMGAGMGFRIDVAIAAPIFLGSVVMFTGSRPWDGWREKGLVALSFAAALAVVAGPVIFRISSSGSNGFHVIVLGFADKFDHALGVTRPAYTILPFYDDRYLTNEVRVATGDPSLAFPSPAYDSRSRELWLRIVRNFPADIATRAIAAGDRIMNLPFANPPLTFLSEPSARSNPLWNALTNQRPHRLRAGAFFEGLARLNGIGSLLVIAMIAAAAVNSARLGLFAAALVLALVAYASLQFDARNVFHLEFLPVLAGLVVLRLVTRVLMRRERPLRQQVLRFAASAVAFVAVLVAATASLRAYQTVHLHGLLQRYVDAPRAKVAPQWSDTGAGTWRATWPSSVGDYYEIEYRGGGQSIPAVALSYDARDRDLDYSRIAATVDRDGINRLFVPAFGERGLWEFRALEMTPDFRSRLLGIYRLVDPGKLPFQLDLRLSESWRDEDLFQRLDFERTVLPPLQVIGGAGTKVSRLAWAARAWSGDGVVAVTPRTTYTNALRAAGGNIDMDGRADSESSYLVDFSETTVAGSSALLARGRLERGGLTLGVLKDGRWDGQVFVTAPGEFVAIVALDAAGTYEPIITNATERAGDRTRFSLSRFGIR